MFKMLEKLLLTFSVIIVLSFESAGVSNAEEFADGKYFASVIDSYGVRWNIIVEKSKSSLKVINLNSSTFFWDTILCRAQEMNDKLGTLELDEDLGYDTGWIGYKFCGDWQFRFYGTLGKLSKVQFSIWSSYIEEARFKHKPFKFYDSFLQALITNPKMTTKDFEKTIYAKPLLKFE